MRVSEGQLPVGASDTRHGGELGKGWRSTSEKRKWGNTSRDWAIVCPPRRKWKETPVWGARWEDGTCGRCGCRAVSAGWWVGEAAEAPFLQLCTRGPALCRHPPLVRRQLTFKVQMSELSSMSEPL